MFVENLGCQKGITNEECIAKSYAYLFDTMAG